MQRTALLLLRSFLAPFAVTFPVALFILDMQFLWVYADDLIGKGLSPLIIGELMVYASARLVNLALPLAILVASIMSMGALAERNELTAMKSAGMSLFRIFRPLMVVMALLSVGAFAFSNEVWPKANLKFRALLFSVTKKKPGINLAPGVFYNGIEGFSIRVADKRDDGTLEDVLIHDHREATTGASRIIRAEEGRMDVVGESLVMELRNGVSYEEDMEIEARRKERVQPHVAGTFERQVLRIDLASLDFNQVDEGLFKRVHEMMNIRQLNHAMDSLEGVALQRRKDIVEYGMRMIALPEQGARDEVGGGRDEVGGGRDEVGGGRVEVGGGRVEVGGGRVEAGGGRIEVGGGRVEVGGGRVEGEGQEAQGLSSSSDRRLTTDHRPSTIVHPSTDHRPSTTDHPTTDHRPSSIVQPTTDQPAHWLTSLTPTERRMVFDGARGMARNAIQGVENALEDADKKIRVRNRNAVEWHRKFFLGTSCFLLFFIGAPLGAIIRKGGLGLPTVFAIFVFLVYYILSIVGEQMVRAGSLEPHAGMWLSTAVLTPVAILFTRMAMREVHVLRMPRIPLPWRK